MHARAILLRQQGWGTIQYVVRAQASEMCKGNRTLRSQQYHYQNTINPSNSTRSIQGNGVHDGLQIKDVQPAPSWSTAIECLA